MSDLKVWKCDKCGAPVNILYNTPTKEFLIDADTGEIKRVLQKDILSDNPYLDFVCSNDGEHKIEDSNEFEDWIVQVETDFYDEGHFA